MTKNGKEAKKNLSKSQIRLPQLIDVNLNAIENIANSCNKLRLGKKASLIADNITYSLLGKKAEEILVDNDFEVSVLKIKDASFDEIEKAKAVYTENKCEFTIGVGGGTVIDVAKYSGYESGIPFVSVPTAASHDGIASSRASIKHENKNYSLSTNPPILVIGDIETVSKAPKKFSIAGAGDLLSNKSAVLDWELSNRINGEELSHYSILLSRASADSVILSQEDLSINPIFSAHTILKGLITSSMAMCIAGSSRPSSGAEHLISHRLDKILERPRMHGLQVALASLYTIYLHNGNWQEIKDTCKTIDCPVTLNELDIDLDVFVEAILTAQEKRPDRFTILKVETTKKGIEQGLKKVGII